MAHFIYNPGQSDKTQPYKIAENDSAKSKMNITEAFVTIPVTDLEFNYIKQDVKRISGYDGNAFTFEDVFHEIADADQLNSIIQNTIKEINDWLEVNSNHADYAVWNTYKTTLENFNTSSITYPLNTSWNKYCEDNNIAYKSLLELS